MKTKATVVKNKIIAELLNDFCDVIRTEECIRLGRKELQHFTRKRKLTFFKVIIYFIFRYGKYSNQDLTHFFSALDDFSNKPSKQALFSAMRKVDPDVFYHLIQNFAKLFYGSRLVKRYRGYLILAEDGSRLDAPLSDDAIDMFGFHTGQHVKCREDVKSVASRIGGLYDVTNGFFPSVTIKGCHDSELSLAHQNISKISELINGQPTIFLADRYYGGIELFQTLQMQGIYFCIRGKSRCYEEQIRSIETDGWIRLNITERWLHRLNNAELCQCISDQEQVTVRVIKHTLDHPNKDGETQHLYFTNLPDDEFSAQDIADLYKMRWDIETNFKYYKLDLETERFNTNDCQVYLCKVLAKVILLNFVGIIKAEANAKLRLKRTEKHTEGFKTKFNCLLDSVLHSCLLKALFEHNMRLSKMILKEILLTAFKNAVPIRNNRHYDRNRQVKRTKYRFSCDGREKRLYW